MSQVWTNLQSPDPKTLADRLRAAGFPASMIRALVAAQIQQQFSSRRAALLAQREEKPFWKAQPSYFADPKITSEMRELNREQSNLLKQLFGSEGAPGNEEAQSYQRRQFGNISRDKMEQMQSILSDYGDLRNQVYMTANGIMLPEDREKISLLEKEQRADIAAVLTPQEMEDYELRSSQTANQLRSQLALFNPTEQEFRAIFKLQQAFDDKYGSPMTMTAASFRERQARQQELTEQIKAVISPDRVDAYKQAVDPAYQTLNRIVARLDLPASTAPQVVAVQQDINQRAGLLRSDKSLSPDVKNAQLGALAQEATTRLTTVLGTRGLDAYKQYGGQWIQNLAPRTTPPGGAQ